MAAIRNVWQLAWLLAPGLAGLASFTLVNPDRVQAQSISDLQYQVQLAICQSQWQEAAIRLSPLIAATTISADYRAELVAFRQQLLTNQATRAIAASSASCEAMLAHYVDPGQTSDPAPPLNWAGASDTLDSPQPRLPDQQARQQAALARAGLLDVQPAPIAALSPATAIDTSTGTGVSAGSVSDGVNVFSFVGGQGDQVTLNIHVTKVLRGSLYTDDDSQLFLFDNQGILLAENDDLSRLQSQISNFTLPRSGLYYLAVTTYNNDPLLDGDRKITGWSANGGSALQYTLTITGVTPTAQLTLPPTVQTAP